MNNEMLSLINNAALQRNTNGITHTHTLWRPSVGRGDRPDGRKNIQTVSLLARDTHWYFSVSRIIWLGLPVRVDSFGSRHNFLSKPLWGLQWAIIITTADIDLWICNLGSDYQNVTALLNHWLTDSFNWFIYLLSIYFLLLFLVVSMCCEG